MDDLDDEFGDVHLDVKLQNVDEGVELNVTGVLVVSMCPQQKSLVEPRLSVHGTVSD